MRLNKKKKLLVVFGCAWKTFPANFAEIVPRSLHMLSLNLTIELQPQSKNFQGIVPQLWDPGADRKLTNTDLWISACDFS